MSSPIPDLVIRGALPLRAAEPDHASAPRPAASPVTLIVRDGRIAWIGPMDQAPEAPGAETIDATGLHLLPGFCESHLHLLAGGVSLSWLDLRAAHSTEEMTALLQAQDAILPPGECLCAAACNYDAFGPGTRPDRHRIDAILPDRPAQLISTEFHSAWVNTAALEAAGLMDADPAAFPEGVILGEDGKPTGELNEAEAMSLVHGVTPSGGREGLGIGGADPAEEPDAAMREHDKAAILRALDECVSLGITAAVNMDGNLYQASLFKELAEADLLPIPVSLPMTLAANQTPAHRAAMIDQACAEPIGKLSFKRLKFFMDGVLDTWTALRVDDYPERPGWKGEPLWPADLYAAICVEGDAKGLQLTTHAVGDGAVRAALDGYEAARRANGPRDSRHRIEHIELLDPADRPRFAELGVIASFQPVHPPGCAGLPLEPTLTTIGRARWDQAYAWAWLRDAGAKIAFGTDWPVSPLSPLFCMHSALSRAPWTPETPDQRLTPAESFAAYAEGGAYARFAETETGRLAPGLLADLVLLEGDPMDLARAPDACRVAMTVAAGRVLRDARGDDGRGS